MMVHVRLFARLRDLAGRDQVSLLMPEDSTVACLRKRLAEALPVPRDLLGRCAIAVNDEVAEEDGVVSPGAEIALLPPVSGGQDQADR
jgi:molybdopterin converting factor subunit 1